MTTDPQRAPFVGVSALLTGFNANVIAPGIDPVDLPSQFLSLARARTGKPFTTLLDQFQTLSAQTPPLTPQQIGEQLLGLNGHEQDPQVAAVAQAIMKLWYLGSWYQPYDFTTPDGQTFTEDLIFGVVASSQAYIAGLSWQVMQSHAMGNSTWTFGYWAKQPPALDEFTGNFPPAPPAPASPAPAPSAA